jgi:hypothetical protein
VRLLEVQLGARHDRLRLEHVGDRGDTGTVSLVGRFEIAPGLFQVGLARHDERLGVEVRVVGAGDGQHHVLDRGVVAPVGGVEGGLRLRDIGGAPPEVEEQPVEGRGGTIGRLKERELPADGGGLLPGDRAIELDDREESGPLDADLSRGGAGKVPGLASDGVVAQRDVHQLGERQRRAGLQVLLGDLERLGRGFGRAPFGRGRPGDRGSRRDRCGDRALGSDVRAAGGE